MAIEQEQLQALAALQGLLGNPMQDLQGLVGLSTGLQQQGLTRRQEERALKEEERQLVQAKNAFTMQQAALKEMQENFKFRQKELAEQARANQAAERIHQKRLDLEKQQLEQSDPGLPAEALGLARTFRAMGNTGQFGPNQFQQALGMALLKALGQELPAPPEPPPQGVPSNEQLEQLNTRGPDVSAIRPFPHY